MIRDEGLVEKSRMLGERMLARLRAIDSPALKDVRGRGLWAGARSTRRWRARARPASACWRRVCSKETHHTVVRLAPPLVISCEDLDWVLDRFEDVLHELDGTRRLACGVKRWWERLR